MWIVVFHYYSDPFTLFHYNLLLQFTYNSHLNRQICTNALNATDNYDNPREQLILLSILTKEGKKNVWAVIREPEDCRWLEKINSNEKSVRPASPELDINMPTPLTLWKWSAAETKMYSWKLLSEPMMCVRGECKFRPSMLLRCNLNPDRHG